MDLVLWVLVIGTLCWLFTLCRKPAKYPPGPVRLPIIGTMWKSNRRGVPPFIQHCEMARQYGKVVGYYAFHKRLVMIFDVDVARQVFAQNQTTGRPHLEILKMRTFGELRGILFNEGQSWQRHRRFALHHLRDFGMGHSSLESITQREITDLVSRLSALDGKPVLIEHFFNVSMLNVPWEIVASKRFQPDDPRLPLILRAISDVSSQSTGLLNQIKLMLGVRLGFLLSNSLYKAMEQNRDGLAAILKVEIEEHRRTLNPESPRDFIDTFLIEMSSSTSEDFTELSLYSVLMDLFTASTGTNSVTLEWAMLFLLLYPECGRRARQELAQVVGTGRMVTLNDQPHLPYTQALVAETMRRSSVLAVGLPHRTMADITAGGYHVPKDTRLLVNLYAIHHDREYWGDPFNFRPERFLHDGQFRSDKHLVPFSIGKRACLGESLARMEQFLFLANIVHHFEVLVPEGDPAPKFEYVCGTRNSPKPFRVVFKPNEMKGGGGTKRP